MDQPFHYRNKAQFPVGKSKDGRIITGFYAGRTHSIIENRDCALGVTRNKEVLDRVIAHMEKFHIQPYDENTGKGLVRHVLIRYGFFTDEMIVCLIINGEKLPSEEALVKSLRQIPETVSDRTRYHHPQAILQYRDDAYPKFQGFHLRRVVFK